MKAARVISRRKIEFLDTPEPKISKKGDIKVKIEALSVCGSDIYLEYDNELSEEKYPFIPGAPSHECAGTVVESTDPDYKEGQRVIIIPENINGMQEYLVQDKHKLIKLPDWGSMSEWVMCQHSGTVLYSSKKWGNISGKTLAILGQGGIGLSFTMLGAKQGAKILAAIDLEQYRLKKSLEFGASHSINPSNENMLSISEEITNGKGFDVVVDASGDPNGINHCIDLVKNEGQIISFSLIRGGKPTLEYQKFMSKNLNIVSTVVAVSKQPIKEIKEMVNYKKSGWMDPGLLKTHDCSWTKAQEALEMYRLRQDKIIKIAMSVD